MILISHRGNIDGKIPELENHPEYLQEALDQGYNVELDIWYKEGLWLGHDYPKYEIDLQWLLNRRNELWIHAKNYEVINKLIDYDLNIFWHQEDDVTLTSKNYLWSFPGKQPIKKSIAVMPELNDDNLSQCIGVCSDYIEIYKIKSYDSRNRNR